MMMMMMLYVSQIVGLNTNIQFLDDLAGHPEFQLGHVHTGFIAQHNEALFPQRTIPNDIICQAALAIAVIQADTNSLRLSTGQFHHVLIITSSAEVNSCGCQVFLLWLHTFGTVYGNSGIHSAVIVFVCSNGNQKH